jgi:uncharacterized metal-binding protein YceD (DUF177 family)
MGKFDAYKIPLKSLDAGKHEFKYVLDDKFFKDIDGEEFKKGKINAEVTVKKLVGSFELTFKMEGTVKVPCDRCLDDVEMPVEYDGKLFVKFGKTYSEESDDVIIIPEDEELNIAWFFYEFAVLTLPIKRVHPPGKCNKTVSGKLKKHTAVSSDEDGDDSEADFGDIEIDFEPEEKDNDPRWDKLKDINIE